MSPALKCLCVNASVLGLLKTAQIKQVARIEQTNLLVVYAFGTSLHDPEERAACATTQAVPCGHLRDHPKSSWAYLTGPSSLNAYLVASLLLVRSDSIIVAYTYSPKDTQSYIQNLIFVYGHRELFWGRSTEKSLSVKAQTKTSKKQMRS